MTKKSIKKRHRQKGIALLLAILGLVILSILGFGLVAISTSHAKTLGNTNASQKAYYLAQVGTNIAMANLSTDAEWGQETITIEHAPREIVRVRVEPHPGNTNSSYKKWKVVAEGEYEGLSRTVVSMLHMELFSLYSYYGFFEDPNSWLTDGQEFTGKMHTNSYLRVRGNPLFTSKLTSSNLTLNSLMSNYDLKANQANVYKNFFDTAYNANTGEYTVGSQVTTDKAKFYRPFDNNYEGNAPAAKDNSPSFVFSGGEPPISFPELSQVPAMDNYDVKIGYFSGETYIRFTNDSTGCSNPKVGKIQVFFEPSENDKEFFKHPNPENATWTQIVNSGIDNSKLGHSGGVRGDGTPDYMPQVAPGKSHLQIGGAKWVPANTFRYVDYNGNLQTKGMWMVEYEADNITIVNEYIEKDTFTGTNSNYDPILRSKVDYDYLNRYVAASSTSSDSRRYADLVIIPDVQSNGWGNIHPSVFKGKATIVSSDDILIRGSVVYDDPNSDVLGIIARKDIQIQTKRDRRHLDDNRLKQQRFSDTPDDQVPNLHLDMVMMSIAGSFKVRDFNATGNPQSTFGKLSLFGGLQQFYGNPTAEARWAYDNKGELFLTYRGFSMSSEYDEKLKTNPPPNYPTTGKLKLLAQWDSGALGGCAAGFDCNLNQ